MSHFEKLEVKYETPNLPKISKFNYKSQKIDGERNLINRSVKSDYTANFYKYETTPVKVLVVGHLLTN